MDGKQARKTGQSTCLGMLFDHGFDAVNAILQAMTISRCFMFNSVQTSVAVLISAIGFFGVTFETYATKTFYLPRINAVNEGMLSILAGIILTAIVGPDFWIGTFIGVDRRTLIVAGSTLLSLILLYGK